LISVDVLCLGLLRRVVESPRWLISNRCRVYDQPALPVSGTTSLVKGHKQHLEKNST